MSAFLEAAPRLWTLAASILGERNEAQDVLQEAGMIALERLDDFRRGTSFRAWMGRVVRNVALNHARRRRPTPVADDEALERAWHRVPASEPGAGAGQADEPLPVVTPLGELESDQAQLDDEVVQALDTLAPIARACVLLRTVQQSSYADISELLGIPEGTAMSHVHRSRSALRRLLAQRRPLPARSAPNPGEEER